jgi:hypothetical protein
MREEGTCIRNANIRTRDILSIFSIMLICISNLITPVEMFAFSFNDFLHLTQRLYMT